ncbi:MAG: ribonuclease P protein component [Acidovorax sp.]|uniref:ribonuclease P protein component n=1 Tax=Acidovorax sp. TaxID=1872122 RepID=UPI0039E69B99
MLRLKTRPQFQAAMAGGIVSRTAHFALHRLLLADAPPSTGPGSPTEPQALFSRGGSPGGVWLGAMVPKRWARRAVTRNTIKRQIYAVGAGYEARLAPAAHVVRLRSGFDRRQFVSATSEPLRLAVRTELQQLFSRAAAGAGAP